MAGFSGVQRGADGFQIAHFADQDDVRILTQGGAQRGAERRRIHFHFALVDVALLVAMQKFDRVFDGDDVFGAGGVDAVHHGGQRRRFTGAGNAGDQNQAARHFANLFHDLGQVKFVEGANFGGDDAQHQSHVAALLENVHTEAAQSGDAVGHVNFRGFFEFLLLARRHHAERHGQHVFGADAGLVGQRSQVAIDAQMGIVADLQMQVGGPALHGDAQQVINIHSTLPPDNLPYDDAKSHSAQDDLSNWTSGHGIRLLRLPVGGSHSRAEQIHQAARL